MDELIELIIARHFPDESLGYSYKRLTKGVSSESYKVKPNVDSSQQAATVLTLIRDPQLWWKVEQEFIVRNLVDGDSEMPFPQLFDAGFDEIKGEKIAFIIREFVQGVELDAVLNTQLRSCNRDNVFSTLAHDLGYRLGILHTNRANIFGQLAKPGNELYSNWASFVLAEIENEVRSTYQLPEDKQLGRVRVGNIQALLPNIQKLVGSLQSSLFATSTSKLVHGDIHFKNIIVGNSSQVWKVECFIDTDEVLGGDPGIDIAYIENWLHFSSYKEVFLRQCTEFQTGYKNLGRVGARYPDSRLIYHVLRSLSFLRTVFEFDTQVFLFADSKNEEYVFLHFQILHSLASGNALQDIGVTPLL